MTSVIALKRKAAVKSIRKKVFTVKNVQKCNLISNFTIHAVDHFIFISHFFRSRTEKYFSDNRIQLPYRGESP